MVEIDTDVLDVSMGIYNVSMAILYIGPSHLGLRMAPAVLTLGGIAVTGSTVGAKVTLTIA